MGVFEDPRFGAGTRTLATAVASTDAFTVVGGGDTGGSAQEVRPGLPGRPPLDGRWGVT